MNPLLILVPALGLIIGPRLWVNRVIGQYDSEDDRPDSAHEIAREMLDRVGLEAVRVEPTDGGDHYDPQARAVRLSRHNFDRRSLSALTTAAHEVAHAIQHAEGFRPFAVRTRLARLAQVTGEVGSVLLIAVPVTFLLTRQVVPRAVVGTAALGMLGTSTAAQIAALPTELDASFRRALPMLRDGYIRDDQVEPAERILYACSLTYVAASFSGILHLWPWLARGPMAVQGVGTALAATADPVRPHAAAAAPRPAAARRAASVRGGPFEAALRRVAKPLIRGLAGKFHRFPS